MLSPLSSISWVISCCWVLLVYSSSPGGRGCEAFQLATTSSHRSSRRTSTICRRPVTATPQQHEETTENHVDISMEHEIQELQQQAAARLDALLEQMEDLKQLNHPTTSTTTHVDDDKSNHPLFPSDAASETETSRLFAMTTTTKMRSTQDSTASNDASRSALLPSPKVNSESAPTKIGAEAAAVVPLDLLDDTVWKIAFSLGREPGTWMPPEWGISGDRLRFVCPVEFTTIAADDNDEFFRGTLNSPVRQLRVHTDASYIVPHQSKGRRPLPVQATGLYQVCRGQGPAGTDIVRLCVSVGRTVAQDDVVCPAGRVYGTCGYFGQGNQHAERDAAQAHYLDAIQQHETAQQQAQQDDTVLSLEHWRHVQNAWTTQRTLQEAAHKLQTARLRYPERAQLRLDTSGRVGLSKEGGVCCKVRKGMTLEYHILGRMQVACIKDERDDKATALSSSLSSATP